MKKFNSKKGQNGEKIALEYLEKQGMEIIEKNWRFSRLGEIDIIVKDGETLVFVEVKAKSSKSFGHPLESINQQKFDKIKKLAEIYINLNSEKLKFTQVRFDAVGIVLNPSNPFLPLEITHLKSVY